MDARLHDRFTISINEFGTYQPLPAQHARALGSSSLPRGGDASAERGGCMDAPASSPHSPPPTTWSRWRNRPAALVSLILASAFIGGAIAIVGVVGLVCAMLFALLTVAGMLPKKF